MQIIYYTLNGNLAAEHSDRHLTIWTMVVQLKKQHKKKTQLDVIVSKQIVIMLMGAYE